MPVVRTICPSCGVVLVEAPAVTVRIGDARTRSEALFECPACRDEVVLPLDNEMLPVLIGAGCHLDPDGDRGRGPTFGHPSFGPQLTDAEIDAFVTALDRTDWLDELLS